MLATAFSNCVFIIYRKRCGFRLANMSSSLNYFFFFNDSQTANLGVVLNDPRQLGKAELRYRLWQMAWLCATFRGSQISRGARSTEDTHCGTATTRILSADEALIKPWLSSWNSSCLRCIQRWLIIREDWVITKKNIFFQFKHCTSSFIFD